MKRFLICSLLGFGLHANAIEIEVDDQKGRSLTIDLLKCKNEKVTFTKKGKVKKFVLPLSAFSEASQKSIKKIAETLPAPLPELEVSDAIISKKTRDRGRSWYMETQDISGRIRIKNTSRDEIFEGCKTTILIIGQDQHRTELYKILSNQTFKSNPDPGKIVEHELEAAFTEYDSDNKGRGNIGGFAYCGYLIVITDDEDRIVNYKVQGSGPKCSWIPVFLIAWSRLKKTLFSTKSLIPIPRKSRESG